MNHIENYTYFYVDTAVEKQEEKVKILEEKLIELVIIEDELEQVKLINEEIKRRYEELHGRHNKVIDEKNTLEEMNEDITTKLETIEAELSKNKKNLRQ